MEKFNISKDTRELIDAIFNLRLCMKQYIQRKIREDQIDLTYEMLQVLTVLWRTGHSNQQEIANRIQKNKASLTSLLDNLTKRNLIIRTEDPSDRRNKIISLTKIGREYEIQFKPILDGFYQSIQEGLSKEKLIEVTNVLKVMQDNLA